MKLVSWNVNGLRSVFNKGFDEYLINSKPDLLCLQESKVQLDQLAPEQSNPEGFSLELNSAKKKGYSGVALYRAEHAGEPKATEFGLGQPRFDDEGRYLITHFADFTLYNIYFPSGTSGDERQSFKYEFLEHLYEHFSEMSQSQRQRCIVCGDFNICHRPIDIHHPTVAEKRGLSGYLPDERAWMDRFVDLGFIDTFRHCKGDEQKRFSWWSYRANSRQKNLGWRIDYIFVGEALASSITNAEIHESVLGSDHCPISVELDIVL